MKHFVCIDQPTLRNASMSVDFHGDARTFFGALYFPPLLIRRFHMTTLPSMAAVTDTLRANR